MEQTGNLDQKFSSFSNYLRPKVITALHGQEVKLVKVQGGAEHSSAADNEAEVLIVEPADVLNTGNVVVEHFTAPKGIRI